MPKTRYILIILSIIILVTGAAGAEDIMPLTEVEPGMTGVGKTVFRGTRVEEFPIEIVSILENDMNKDLILIKATGEKIDRINGIAAGMSGSPVYINQKLIGAVAYAWKNTDLHYAMVTPMARMMDLLKNDNKEKNLSKKSKIQSSFLNTPLMVKGMKGRALNRIKEQFSASELKVLPGARVKKENADAETLKPGSAVSVQLVRGDINIASLGTLTYIDKGKILAFGHPFTNKGEVNYLLSKAYINTIIPSQNQPFKLGTPFSRLLGTVNMDRGAGIAGTLKQYPSIIPLRVRVKDESRNIEKEINVQMIDDDSYLPTLGNNIALQAIDNTIDRIGKGTAHMKIKLLGKGIPEQEKLVRENIFYSNNDIAVRALSDFNQLLNIVSSNPFKKIEILDLVLELEINKKEKTALLQEAEILNEKVNPGDTLRVEVTFHPFRRETFTQEIQIELPEDINKGLANVVITGGYVNSYNELPESHQEEDLEVKQTEITGYKNFSSIIEDYLEAPQNNDMIAQVYPQYQPQSQKIPAGETFKNKTKKKGQEKEDNQGSLKSIPASELQPGPTSEKSEDKIKKVVNTDFVLEGELNLQVKIEEKGEEENKEKSSENDN